MLIELPFRADDRTGSSKTHTNSSTIPHFSDILTATLAHPHGVR